MSVTRSTCVLLCVLCLAQCSYSQSADCELPAVVVNARDKHGHFLPSLQTSDFRARFGGENVSVASLTPGASPFRVVILLDKSGSMNSEMQRKVEQFITDELVHSLPASTQFALIVFASRVLETVEFGHSRAEILSAVDRLSASAGEEKTALRDSQLYASDLFGTPQIGDSVVVVSDSQDNHSHTSSSAVQQAYWSKGIRVFLFEILDRYSSIAQEALAEEEEQEAFILGTGGDYRSTDHPEPSEVSSAVHDLADDLSNYYVLRLGKPQRAGNSTSLQLEVVDSSGRKRKGVSLAFPKRIRPCEPRPRP